jgi:hypothetical protein
MGAAFGSSSACCNHLRLNGGISATTGGACTQAASNSSSLYCYIADEATKTCTQAAGTSAARLCSAAGPKLSFSEPTPCCNKLAQLGVSKQDMQGACAPVAAEAVPRCYSLDLAAGSCDAVADAERCDSLWLARAHSTSGNGTIFDSQQLCCNAVAAAIGDAMTTGVCKVIAGAGRICHFCGITVFALRSGKSPD